MDHYFKRIQKALDDGHYEEALRDSNRLLICYRNSKDDEAKEIRERVIQLIHESGIVDEILLPLEDKQNKGCTVPFGWIYELYKFEAFAFNKPSLRITECFTYYYEKTGDGMAGLGWSETLLEYYIEEGRDDMIESARKRVEANIQHLRNKAENYQKTGEHRYAFNSYRCLLESDFDCYEYHLGYLFNAIKSGKPEEAYKTILKDKAHRDYILADTKLSDHYYDLAYVVAVDEELPDILQ